MKNWIILTLVLLTGVSQAYAFTVSDQKAECSFNGLYNPPSARFKFQLDVEQDAGTPGLVYLAMVDPAKKNAYFFISQNVWNKWDGGLFPILSIERNGVQPMQITADLGTAYKAYAGYTLYVGYGLHHPEMETVVSKRRQGLNKARQAFPDRNIYDPGDDYMRRSLIERELRDTQRFKEVMTLQCFTNGFNSFTY